ncbi:MAG: site-specific integrase [Acidimicrobiia bacterium]|nr:site-specific integrase [Acidimicrobiia bacterium]
MAHIRRARSGQGWEARYRDPHGKERARTFNTKRDAQQFIAGAEADLQRGDWLDPRVGRIRFDDWADEWLATAVHLKPNTRYGYERLLERHVLPVFGGKRIANIERIDVRRFVSDMTTAGMAAGTVRNAFTVVRNVFNIALDSGAVKANPCARVKMPRSPRAEMLFLDPAQIVALAEAIGDEYALLVKTAAYTGLRAGELQALRVRRVDLDKCNLDVVESLSEVEGQLIFGETKTYSRRQVGVPASLAAELRLHITTRSLGPDDLVFAGPRGGPMRHNNFYNRHFKPAVVRGALPDGLRFHDLRHTCAALLISEGAHPRAIMERLGHSTVQVAIDRYGHLFPRIHAELTDSLDKLYRGGHDDPTSAGATSSDG